MIIRYLIFVFFMKAGFSNLAYAQQLSDVKTSRIDSLFMNWDSTRKPGVAVGILWQGKVVYQKGFGMANIKKKHPITPSTEFWIASVSKQFTAMNITALEQQGKIELDEPAATYLPELKQFPKITIRHLLHHSSGLRDGFTLVGLTFRGEKHYDTESILEMIAKQKDLNFEPGSRYEYNNSNYVLLSVIIERATGKSLATSMEELVFEPLEMKNSRVFSGITPNTATGYIAQKTKYKTINRWLPARGSTGVMTTLEDLIKLEQQFHLKDKDILSVMTEQFSLSDGKESFYTRGVEVYNVGERKVISHFGSDPGFRADLVRIPQDELSIILLSNAGNYWDLMKHTLAMAGIILDYEPFLEQSQAVREIKIADENLSLEGVYLDTISKSEVRIVKIENDVLKVANSVSGYYTPLVPYGTNRFKSTSVYETEYTFEEDKLAVKIRDGEHIFIKQKEPSKADLSRWKGKYYSQELNKVYRITYKRDQLRLSIFRVYHVPLKNIDNQTFMADFMGNNVLEFSETASSQKVMKFSRLGIKNLHFTKKGNR